LNPPDWLYGRIGFNDAWATESFWAAWTWDFGSTYSNYACKFWWRGTHGFYATAYSPSGDWKWQNSTDGSTWSDLVRITFNPSGPGDTGYRTDEVPCNFRYLKAIVSGGGNSITLTTDFSVDSIRVRKYISPEPTTSVGDEENACLPSSSTQFLVNVTDLSPTIGTTFYVYYGNPSVTLISTLISAFGYGTTTLLPEETWIRISGGSSSLLITGGGGNLTIK
jgi:hypothetical protein